MRIVLRAVGSEAVAFPRSPFAEGAVGFGIKVNRIGTPVVPSATNAGISAHFPVGQYLYLRAHKLLGLACVGHRTFAQEETSVDGQCLVRYLGISKAVERGSLGGGYLRTDAALLETGVVVAQAYIFVLAVIEMLRAVQCSTERSHQHIAILRSAPCAADVHLGKTVYPFGHGQPATVGRRRTVGRGFHHAKGTRRTDKDTPQSFGTDTRIDVVRQRSFRLCLPITSHGSCTACQQKGQQHTAP